MQNHFQRAARNVIMSDRENNPPPDSVQSRDDFVRHLRAKAESAAEASVHHATLSQQYMELSQKLAQLAEQAGSRGLAELQHSMHQLESRVPAVVPAQPATASPPIAGLVGSTSADLTADRNPDLPPPNPFATEPSTSTALDHCDHNETDSSLLGATGQATRRQFVNVRKIVERTRAVKLAAAKRVRVKAKKSDLKLKQRTATEELRKGRRSIVTSLIIFALILIVMNLITWQLEIETPLPR